MNGRKMESGSGVKDTGEATGCGAIPPGDGRGERGFTELRATSTICSGDNLLWLGNEPEKRDALGDEGRSRGDVEGLAGRPGGAPEDPVGEKDVNAKLSLPPGPSLFPEALEFNEALLPCRLCRLGGSSTSACGTRTMVSRLVSERAGFMFTSLCSPQGSTAATEPRLADSLRARAFGLRIGLSSGEVIALMVGCSAGRRGERDERISIDGSKGTYLDCMRYRSQQMRRDICDSERSGGMYGKVVVRGRDGKLGWGSPSARLWVSESIERSANQSVRQVSFTLGDPRSRSHDAISDPSHLPKL